MRMIFEAHMSLDRKDFDVENEARAAVEANGSGYVVTYVRGYANRDRSCAMNVFRDGGWQGVDISR